MTVLWREQKHWLLRVLGWGCWLLACVWSGDVVAGAGQKTAKEEAIGPLYSKAMRAFGAQKWVTAQAAFRRLLPKMESLQAKRPKGSKSYHLMTLGRCDVLYHLASIRWAKKELRASCRLHQRLADLAKQLPAGWRRWQVHPEVPHRLSTSASHLGNECQTVPSLITFALVPATAKVSMKTADGQWIPLPAQGFPTRKRALTLRVEATGYETRIVKQLTIGRWQLRKLALVLKKKPPKARPRLVARKAPRRPPPKPPAATPFYKTWWFWTITGVVVAGGVVLAVGLTLRDRELTFEQNEQGGTAGSPIW